MNTLHYLIAYDIADKKRLKKIASCCELYGLRIEKSVFQATLPDKLFEAFWNELKQIADETQDVLVAYRLCNSCLNNTKTIGTVPQTTPQQCFFI